MSPSASALPLGLPVFALEDHFAQWEFRARHHLTASDAQTVTVAELCDLADDPDAARAGLLDHGLGYVPTWGTDALRAAVAATYDGLRPEHVLAFAGAEEALFWLFQALLGPGDHAVVTVPCYQAAESVPLRTGADVTGVPLWRGEGADLRWHLDVDAVAAALRPTTRVVAVNVPNNPTGYVPDAATWAALVALCEDRGVTLVSDEVYRGIETDPARTLPAAADLGGRTVSVGVLSKAHGLPGLRVGWVATRDTALLARLERAKHWTSICNAGPSEYLAVLALGVQDRLLARNRALVARNTALLDAFVAEHADVLSWQPPDGGCVAFARYAGDDGVEAFCARALEREGVLLLPGSLYASDLVPVPGDRFRISVGRRGLEQGLAALARCVRRS